MTDMGVKLLAKTMKLGRDDELETALHLWFKQKREDGIPITGAILQAKARELHTELSKVRSDEAAQVFTLDLAAWLWRFCQHHNIRQLLLQGK